MPPKLSPVLQRPAAPLAPSALTLALFSAFCATPALVAANPTGGVAIHGTATFSTPQANTLLVNTQNGAGTNYSAINWQSFSIPAGSTTRIEQPNAASMSINRVVTNTPSLLFGTLSSNGKVVLVNQAGIAVGAGALVDTAGFTASAVGMSDADASSARLRFTGDGTGNASGALTVQGTIIARGGDVVLIAPSIELAQTAVVESQGGSVILAAGQSVEITGRGLEGITLQVQAPTDQAVNLGTLKGDAVGIFAGTLKHSGLIQAVTATMEGGRVVLNAIGDAYVEGSGRIEATGTTGGQVDVFGQRVAVTDQAVIDASGQSGGGTIRVGGDYQGKNADVPNSEFLYFGPQASIKANATGVGNGGRIILWADDTTRAYGNISATGGTLGGNGGFVETSGKQSLDVGGLRVDTRAPLGATGLWLLDPSSIDIQTAGITASVGAAPNFTSSGVGILTIADLLIALAANAVSIISTDNLRVVNAIVSASGNGLSLKSIDGALSINAPIALSNAALGLESTNGSTVLAANISLGTGNLKLKSGGSITQTAGTITAAGLESDSHGATTLNQTSNAVGTIAANVSGTGNAFSYKGNTALTVGTVGARTGIVTSGGDVSLEVSTNGISIANNIAVESGAVTLKAGGSISQTNATGNSIVAKSLTITTGQGAQLQDTGNNVESFSATQNAGTNAISYWDTNAFSLGAITALGDLSLKSNNGAITQTGVLSAASGITTLEAGTGDITLTNVGNDFSSLAITSAGTVNIKDANALTLNSIAGAPATLLTSLNIHAVGNLTLSATNFSVGGTGDAMVLRTDGTFNHLGTAVTMTAPNGRWLIYLKNPGGHTFKSTPAFKQYNAAPGDTVLGTGNGVLYNNTTPAILTLNAGADALTGLTSKVYDGSTSISLTGATYGTIAGGLIDGDTVTNPNTVTGGTGVLSDASVGTGKLVTANNVTVGTITGGNGITTVYGYRVRGNVGIVTAVNAAAIAMAGDVLSSFAEKFEAVVSDPQGIKDEKKEAAKDAVVVEAEICRP